MWQADSGFGARPISWGSTCGDQEVFAQEVCNDDLTDELLALLTKEGQSKDYMVDPSCVLKGVSVEASDVQVAIIGCVDSLAPRSVLPFDQRLLVICGNNGFGKPGYVSVLKKLCDKSVAA